MWFGADSDDVGGKVSVQGRAAFRSVCAPEQTDPLLLGRSPEYRCEATTLEGFIQQLAVCYVGRGYFFYVTGEVPGRKDPRAVDAKLLDRYDIAVSKWTRARRKRAGRASLQYIRHRRFFVLLATHGRHRFFEDEPGIRDVRRSPIRYGGYSVGFRGGHPHVRIDQEAFKALKAYFLDMALRRGVEGLAREFYGFPFEPYAPIRRQQFSLLHGVNRARKAAGLEPVPSSCIWLKRRIYRPFESR